jgi:hypothetical protein
VTQAAGRPVCLAMVWRWLKNMVGQRGRSDWAGMLSVPCRAQTGALGGGWPLALGDF